MTLLKIARQLVEQQPNARSVRELSLPEMPSIVRRRPQGNQSLFAPSIGAKYSKSQVRNAVLSRWAQLRTSPRERMQCDRSQSNQSH